MIFKPWPNTSVDMLILVFISFAVVSAKTGVDEANVNIGWPNFFNPKQSILRENENDKKSKIRTVQNNAADPGNGNKDDLSEASEENDVEELIDYTVKGGLRGTYALLNSSTYIENLSEEAQTAIQAILKSDEDVFMKDDELLNRGETTEEGIRLRTPIILKTHSKTLGKYGVRMTFFTGKEFTRMIHFGNWCGKGGRSAPVDNIDMCCLEQEKCYGKLVRQCPDVWTKPYRLMYAWISMDDEPVCVRSDASCINNVCECEREAALCLKHFAEHPEEVPLHVDVSPLFSKMHPKKSKKATGIAGDDLE